MSTPPKLDNGTTSEIPARKGIFVQIFAIVALTVLLLGGMAWINVNFAEGKTLPDLGIFFGRFHPLVVHLPIGLLLVACFVEFFGLFPFAKSWRGQGGVMLWLGTISAVFAVLLGYLWSIEKGSSGTFFSWHFWTGFGVAVVGLGALVFRVIGLRLVSVFSMVICVGLVSAAGHYGGILVYGEHYLTEFMPKEMRTLLGVPDKENSSPQLVKKDVQELVAYEDVILTIFNRSCNECHNAKDAKGELRMDSYEEMMADRESPAIIPGDLEASEIYYRVTTDDEDDFMPPVEKDYPPLSQAEIQILEWWILEAKASPDKTVAEINPSDEILSLLQTWLAANANQ